MSRDGDLASADNPAIGLKSLFTDFTGVDRRLDRAARLLIVPAIPETTGADEGAEFGECRFDIVTAQMSKAEFLQAG